MYKKTVKRILRDLSFVRTGGSDEELKAAQYLKDECVLLGLSAEIEPFSVQMADIKSASLEADGRSVPCRAYRCCGSFEIEAPLTYLPSVDPVYLPRVKDSVVLLDTGVGFFSLRDLVDNGALGIITYDGNLRYADRDVDQKELRSYIAQGIKLPCVSINAKDAFGLVRSGARRVRISISQDEYEGESRSVIAGLPGKNGRFITLTAHYDSTFLSRGAYDNLSGCLGVLCAAESLVKNAPHNYGFRFIFCGSEERGLLGAKSYVASHPDEIELTDLDINYDMIGTYMGKFCATCSAEEGLVTYLEYMGAELDHPCSAKQGVHSSDSTPFADAGVPSVTFVRRAPVNMATIHNRYDVPELLDPEAILADGAFAAEFARRMGDSPRCPVKREIPDNVKKELDEYLFRKRRS